MPVLRLALASLLALTLAGCAAGGVPAPASAELDPSHPVVEVTGDAMRFVPDTLTLAAGEPVTVAFTSRDMLHDLVVADVGFRVVAARGATAHGTLVVDEPGTYELFCSVGNHRARGMVGTLVVQ